MLNPPQDETLLVALTPAFLKKKNTQICPIEQKRNPY
jgi:hypothetical protein